MVANGVSLRAVQMIGGWTSLRMVERYAHLDDAELHRAVRLTHNHAEAAKQGGTQGDTGDRNGRCEIAQTRRRELVKGQRITDWRPQRD